VPVESATYLHQRLLIDTLLTGRADPLFIEEEALWLAARILDRDVAAPAQAPAAPARTLRRHREQAEHVRDILNARFTEPVSLAGLARLAGLSMFHLARVFRRQTSMTLHAYRQALRLRHSVDRLAQPGADLTQIALDLGFSSHSHFTAAFHRAFGVTPSALRRGARPGAAGGR
jgi:AraC-like DNA-binding protein